MITPVFSAWAFRDHSNMLIYLLYMLETVVLLIFIFIFILFLFIYIYIYLFIWNLW